MAAGGLSYHMLNSYGKATLPSVSNWGQNTNILKDPPKGIHTRRIDKVGETSDITKLIDGSGDRACEYIQIYPRGVNPMVGVSFGNNGNNAGAGGRTVGNRGQQASLPYKIGDVFRPPIQTPQELLPLSRLPRVLFSQCSNPENIDFSKKIQCPQTDYRQIKKEVIHTQARPTAVYQYETPLKEPFEIKYVIQNPIKVSANSGVRNIDLTTTNVKIPYNNINDNNAIISYTAPRSGNEQVTYIHDDIELESNLPKYSVRTNIGENINVTPIQSYTLEFNRNIPKGNMRTNVTDFGETQISNRDFNNLPPKPKYGSFETKGFHPVQERKLGNIEKRQSLSSQKAELSKSVYNQMIGRSAVFGSSMSDNYVTKIN